MANNKKTDDNSLGEEYVMKLINQHPKILSGRKNYQDSYQRVNRMKMLIKNYFNIKDE